MRLGWRLEPTEGIGHGRAARHPRDTLPKDSDSADVDWEVVGATALEHAGKVFRLDHVGKGVNDGENHLELGAYG